MSLTYKIRVPTTRGVLLLETQADGSEQARNMRLTFHNCHPEATYEIEIIGEKSAVNLLGTLIKLVERFIEQVKEKQTLKVV